MAANTDTARVLMKFVMKYNNHIWKSYKQQAERVKKICDNRLYANTKYYDPTIFNYFTSYTTYRKIHAGERSKRVKDCVKLRLISSAFAAITPLEIAVLTQTDYGVRHHSYVVRANDMMYMTLIDNIRKQFRLQSVKIPITNERALCKIMFRNCVSITHLLHNLYYNLVILPIIHRCRSLINRK